MPSSGPTLVLAAMATVAGVSLLLAVFPSLVLPAATALGLPVVMYGIISLLELLLEGSKREQRQRQPPPGNVLRVSRAVYEQLDRDVLQLLFSSRDFDSNDYERLMRLEALNEKKHEGASQREIDQLPIVPVTEGMLQASEHSSCSICLSAFEVGTRVRMMQCFHHFHPACIDPWLRDKAECPICKFPAMA